MSIGKTSNTTAIVGKCLEMCPLKERLMREREGVLHKFEWADDDEVEPSTTTSTKRNKYNYDRARRVNRKADASKIVKAFARSAAGSDKTCPEDLRPIQILETTVEYLYREILPRKDKSFTTVYDFIFDRLRSVRQDMVIQRIVDVQAIRIVESIVRFHIYSAHRCRIELITNFDPHINRTHMMNNLNSLLRLYELNDYWEISRNEFETIYLILCPNSTEALQRAFKLRLLKSFMDDKNYTCATSMCLSYQFNNYRNYFRNLKQLPQLHAAAALEHAKYLRGKALRIISKAYGTSTCKFPLTTLQKLLLYPKLSQLEADLRSLSVQISTSSTENTKKYAIFCKSILFNDSQLEGINCDMEPLSGEQSLLNPDQVHAVINLIWPWMSNETSIELKVKDWFANSDEE